MPDAVIRPERKLLINTETAAVVEDGRLCEYKLLAPDSGTVAETIVLGRVERVVKGMDAAFIDIGEERNAFLPLSEKSESFSALPLQSGQPVIVQIKREAHGQKGAFVSRDITLCGENVLLMPMNRYIGVSNKIADPDRAMLKQLGTELADGRFGLVMRTAAAQTTGRAISEEVADLESKWQEIAKAAATAHVPSVLFSNDPLEELMRDYAPRGIDSVITNSETTAKRFRDVCSVQTIGEEPIDASVLKQRDEALGRFVWLKSGASLFIDECEAMTVIDVNSGKFTGKRCQSDTAVRVNLEACGEIARQLRLRSLGGIVIIDFIDMQTDEERASVIDELRKQFLRDRAKTVIHGYTSLGLLELTRKRTAISLRDAMKQIKGEHHD